MSEHPRICECCRQPLPERKPMTAEQLELYRQFRLGDIDYGWSLLRAGGAQYPEIIRTEREPIR